MGAIKAKGKTTKKTSGIVKTGKKLLGIGSKGGGKRRSHGPTYWANKVLVMKLKKKYFKLKYGGR
jgi:hypothetical protein